MKKSIMILGMAAVVMVLSSCSSYTCATYTKGKFENKASEEQTIRLL